ncbi:MAG TPA: hypothetical protein VN420_05215 [Candidatus Fimivivens sp.]|nr:hypothetical protein [Candidatus Fimivivens sp.]
MSASKTKRLEEISVRGTLRFEEKIYFGTGTEISVIGNIFREGVWQEHSLLHINVFLSDEKDDIIVNDNYSDFVPYLKPSKKFREFLGLEIFREVFSRGVREGDGDHSEMSIATWGLVEYAKQLKGYSEDASLVRQAKTEVNKLDAKRHDAGSLARGVLKSLGVTPNVDMPFRHLD